MSRKGRIVVVIAVLTCWFLVLGMAVLKERGTWRVWAGPPQAPFAEKSSGWSIGICTGDAPTRLVSPAAVSNPVLAASQVTDVQADFVADPFMVQEKGKWYMFFEVKDARTRTGKIGFATSSDGAHWKYSKIAIAEPFHMSYPYVFKWQGTYYMVPESQADDSVRLYRAIDFPAKWVFVKKLISGVALTDSSIVHHNNTWWLFTSPPSNDRLLLFYADDLMGRWQQHPLSPVVTANRHHSRPGGRILVEGGRILRFAQDDAPTYGCALHAFEITCLDRREYRERKIEGPLLSVRKEGWNKGGMHTVDAHRLADGSWLSTVDGMGTVYDVGFRGKPLWP